MISVIAKLNSQYLAVILCFKDFQIMPESSSLPSFSLLYKHSNLSSFFFNESVSTSSEIVVSNEFMTYHANWLFPFV